MAQVNFSNAVLDIAPNASSKPMAYGDFLKMYAASEQLYDAIAGGNAITTGATTSIITNTPSKVSILFSGTFIASGTEAYLPYRDENSWRVSNISFSNGDTYNFIIDIETSGNT